MLDPAVPPVKKDRPKRSILVILATLSAIIVAVVYVLVYTWARRHHAGVLARLEAASRKVS